METLFLSCLDYWKHGGILLIPLSVICFFMFFYFFKIFFQIQENLSASFFEHSVDSLLSTAKNEEEIIRVLESKSTFYSKMVIYIIYKIRQGVSLKNIFDEIYEKELNPFFRDLIILKAFVTSAPFLGLLGTVLGMIQTFQVIAFTEDACSKLMADGISQALITTQMGLMIALPGIFGIAFLKRKIRECEVKIRNLEIHAGLSLKKTDEFLLLKSGFFMK